MMLLRELMGQKEMGLLILIRLTPYLVLYSVLNMKRLCNRQIIALQALVEIV